MKEKSLKFQNHLTKLILEGKKDATWRLFDDKDLKVGDRISLIDKDTGETFGHAEITKVYETKMRDISERDFDGHEKFSSHQEMLSTYKSYYGEKVGEETVVKIIKFKRLK